MARFSEVFSYAFLLLSCNGTQETHAKLSKIIESLDLLREELQENLDKLQSMETYTTDCHNEMNHTLSVEEVFKIEDAVEKFKATMINAFTTEKKLRQQHEEKQNQEADKILTRLQSLEDSDRHLKQIISNASDSLEDLKDNQKSERAKMDEMRTQCQNLFQKNNCCNKTDQIAGRMEDMNNVTDELHNRIRALELQIRYMATPINIARGKKAFQSSDYYQGTADKAVDGIIDSNMFSGSCSHTFNDNQAWWMVDLGKNFYVGRVVIYNRMDCCSERLKDFVITVGEHEETDHEVFANGPGSYSGVPVIDLTNSSRPFGRYVKIQLNGKNALQLCEVEVFYE